MSCNCGNENIINCACSAYVYGRNRCVCRNKRNGRNCCGNRTKCCKVLYYIR